MTTPTKVIAATYTPLAKAEVKTLTHADCNERYQELRASKKALLVKLHTAKKGKLKDTAVTIQGTINVLDGEKRDVVARVKTLVKAFHSSSALLGKRGSLAMYYRPKATKKAAKKAVKAPVKAKTAKAATVTPASK